MKIDIIGRGNVGWHLTQAFEGKADVNCVNPCTLEDLRRDADLYLISVTDDAIADVARRLAVSLPTDAVVAHTSGTTGLDAIRPMFANSGVFYPLQTFTKRVSLDYSEIPVMLEASDETTGKTLSAAASMISDKVMEVSSEQRAMYHIASVFSCNFVNHLWALSAEYLAKRGLDFNALLPLIKETARKLEDKTPAEAQTGPAVRHDRLTIDRHTASLARDGENELKEIYVPLTESIMRHHPKSGKK